MSSKNTNFKANDEDAPLDPAVEKVRRKVMRLMGISVAIMMVGLMAVIGAIFYKISGAGDEKTADKAENVETVTLSPPGKVARVDAFNADLVANITLPEGARLVKTELIDGQILLTINRPDNAVSLWIYDLAANRVFARIYITQ